MQVDQADDVFALHDGDELAAPLLLAACLAGLLTVTVMGAVGFLLGREEGRGFWSSVWRGVRMMVGAAFDIP